MTGTNLNKEKTNNIIDKTGKNHFSRVTEVGTKAKDLRPETSSII